MTLELLPVCCKCGNAMVKTGCTITTSIRDEITLSTYTPMGLAAEFRCMSCDITVALDCVKSGTDVSRVVARIEPVITFRDSNNAWLGCASIPEYAEHLHKQGCYAKFTRICGKAVTSTPGAWHTYSGSVDIARTSQNGGRSLTTAEVSQLLWEMTKLEQASYPKGTWQASWSDELWVLQVYAESTYSNNSQHIGYTFSDHGVLVFWGNKAIVPSSFNLGRDHELIALELLEFFALSKDDTDEEYFEHYTRLQLSWRGWQAKSLKEYVYYRQEELNRTEEAAVKAAAPPTRRLRGIRVSGL